MAVMREIMFITWLWLEILILASSSNSKVVNGKDLKRRQPSSKVGLLTSAR